MLRHRSSSWTETAAAPRPSRGAARSALLRAVLLVVIVLATSMGAASIGVGGGHASSALPAALPGQAAASDTLTWSVRPTPTETQPDRPNFSYDVEGGGSVEDSLRVRNFGTAPLTLAVYASDALTTKSGALDLLPANEAPKDVGVWITLAAGTITVEPGRFVDVPFTMQVPRDAESGDHTGGIVTSLSTETAGEGETPVRLDRRLGTRVQVRVGGPLRPRLTITDLDVAYEGTSNPVGKGDVEVTYTVRNTGNVRVTANPTITVKGPLGLTSTTLRSKAMPELLPANSLTFTAEIGAFPVGRLDATVELEPRTTEDRDELPATARTASASASVWAIPWTLLAIVALLVVSALGWRWSRRRRTGSIDAQVQQAVAEALESRDRAGDAAADHRERR